MKLTASVFPVGYYSSPPQTANVTHDHLANPWCEPLPDPFPALPVRVQAVLPCQKPVWQAPCL